jgi:hypothetical protein
VRSKDLANAAPSIPDAPVINKFPLDANMVED